MNKKDLNKMTKAKLVKKLDEVKGSLVNLKFQKKITAAAAAAATRKP